MNPKIALKLIQIMASDKRGLEKTAKFVMFVSVLPFLILILFFVAPIIGAKTIPNTNDAINKIYQDAAANVSSGKNITINWEYLVAIDAVRFDQDFSKTNMQEAIKLANMFVIEKRTETTDPKTNKTTETITYELKSLDEVLNELGFTEEQKNSVYMYLKCLEELYGSGDNNDASGVRYNIPRFYQYDQRWASHPYGNSTILKGGCGPTSFAMVVTGMNPKGLSNMDQNKDGIITPPEAADWSAAHGYKDPINGTAWDFFGAAGKLTGLEVTEYAKGDHATVLQLLKNGYPVIASMGPGTFTQSGHFIVLVGVDDKGKIIVNDPNSEDKSNKVWDFDNLISVEAVKYWVFKKPMGQGTNYQVTAYTGAPNENGGPDGRYAKTGRDLWKCTIKDRVIAVDPRKIKLKQKVYLKFPQSNRYVKLPDGSTFDLNGVYTAEDTGGDIQENRIDLYVGYDTSGQWYKVACTIGRVNNVEVYTDY